MREELSRRKSNVEKLREFFLLRPLKWIDAVDLEPVAGRQAWRTRVSELRQRLEKEGAGTIENRQQFRNRVVVLSEYRYLPYEPLGRDAATHRAGLPLFDREHDAPWAPR